MKSKLFDMVFKERSTSYKEPEFFDISFLKYYSPFIRTNHSIFLVANKYIYPNVVLGLNNYPIMNILNSTGIKQMGYYPMDIRNTNRTLFENFYEFYYCYNGKEFVFSFPFLNDLIFTDNKFEIVDNKPCQSKLVDIKVIYFNNWDDKEKVQKLRNQTPYYYSLVYDTYRNVYYRFVIHGMDKSKNFDNANFFDKNVSIITMDKKNNILSEKLIDNKKYSINIFFVTKDGLHICNRKKSINDENNIYFDIF